MDIELSEVDEDELISSAEIILYDVLPNVFKYLNVYDLSEASKVCKSWYHSASLERLKRGPQIMNLQALEDPVALRFCSSVQKSKHSNYDRYDDLKQSLRIRPKLGMFFTDGKRPTTADCDNVVYEICKTYRWTRPTDCLYVAVEALGMSIDENPVCGDKNETGAVFLPVLPNVKYAIAETNLHALEEYWRNDQQNNLLLDTTNKLFDFDDDLGCFIIFMYHWPDDPTNENYHLNFAGKIIDNIRNRYKPGSYALWGGVINDIYSLGVQEKNLYHATSFFAMRISGPNVRSWSLTINNDLCLSEIKDKLMDFKRHVKIKSSSIALLILPSDQDCADRSRALIFKSLFPTTRLISIFNNRNQIIFSVDSQNDEFNPELTHKNCYAYMILTFKS